MSKVVLIFGGAGGIGFATAREIVKKGYTPVLLGRTDETLRSKAAELGCEYIVCDVTDETLVDKAFHEASNKGEICGVCLSVGSIVLKPLHQTSLNDWNETIQINLTSAFIVSKCAAKYMKQGAVLLFSSAAAQIGLPNHEAIAAAKAGIVGLTRSAAATYASRGLRFNCIAPGLVKTGLSEKIHSNAASEKASLAFHGLSRLGEPEDIASLASWLLSEESSWITGECISLDGGLSTIKNKVPL